MEKPQNVIRRHVNASVHAAGNIKIAKAPVYRCCPTIKSQLHTLDCYEVNKYDHEMFIFMKSIKINESPNNIYELVQEVKIEYRNL